MFTGDKKSLTICKAGTVVVVVVVIWLVLRVENVVGSNFSQAAPYEKFFYWRIIALWKSAPVIEPLITQCDDHLVSSGLSRHSAEL